MWLFRPKKRFHRHDEGYEILFARQAVIPDFQEIQFPFADFDLAHIALRLTEPLRELHLRKT